MDSRAATANRGRTRPMSRVAQGRLRFERVGAATVLRQAYAESPLRLLTPRNHGEGAWVYTGTLGGGLVDGDRVRLRISVGAGARAFVSTQGATRVYRSPRGCESETAAEIADGAALILAPDPTSCYAGSRYQQRTEVDLAEGGSVALWDVLSAGRVILGVGIGWMEDEFRALGIPFDERVARTEEACAALADRLGRFEALATLLLAGPLFAALREELRSRLEDRPVRARSRLLESASALAADVLVVRLAAASVEELVCALRERLAAVPALLGDDPWARRA